MLCIYIFCWYFLHSYDTFCMTTSEYLTNGLTRKHIPFNYQFFLHKLQLILILCKNNYTVYVLVLKVDFKTVIIIIITE